MEEKEERIAVAKMLVNTDDEGSAKLDHFKIYSRQEAIERMAKAICRSGENECIGDCASCDLWKVGPEKDYAEAALNALLEADK